jgi:hypothetical protein
MRADITNRTAIIIVMVKSVFSNPRLVWNAELKLSLPPKAPPTCEPVFCSNIAVTRITASTICMYGSMEIIVFIRIQSIIHL